MKITRTRLAGLAACAALAGCGGGGGGGQSAFERPTDTFNARAAWLNLLAANRSWSVAGTGSDGRNYNFTLALSPAVAAVFPPTGVSSPVTNVQATLTLVGGGSATGLTEVFHDGAGTLLGERQSGDGVTGTACEKITPGTAQLPPTAVQIDTADATGALYRSSSLPSCANTSVDGTATGTWSLEVHAGITYFCLNAVARDLSIPAAVVSSESDCVQVLPDGTLRNAARVRLAVGGFSILATN